MKFILPIAAMIATALSTMVAVVFTMGMGANASPAEVRSLKLWMLCLSLLGAVGILAGIFLLRSGQHNMAAAAAFAPTVIMGIILLVALVK